MADGISCRPFRVRTDVNGLRSILDGQSDVSHGPILIVGTKTQMSEQSGVN